ncbi:MAG: hypothetical protein U0573_07065 [Phycisphaerales bacterium]|nr:hypothetical protein [Planctomycetota bacterium]
MPVDHHTPHGDLLEFRPQPSLITGIIDRLADPDCPLSNIAADFETSIELLCVWMLRPEIAARLDAVQSAIGRRTRLLAVTRLTLAAETAARVLDQFRLICSQPNGSEFDARQDMRAANVALTAARILARIASFKPDPKADQRPSHNPAPRSPSSSPELPTAPNPAPAPLPAQGSADNPRGTSSESQSHPDLNAHAQATTARPCLPDPPPATHEPTSSDATAPGRTSTSPASLSPSIVRARTPP